MKFFPVVIEIKNGVRIVANEFVSAGFQVKRYKSEIVRLVFVAEKKTESFGQTDVVD